MALPIKKRMDIGYKYKTTKSFFLYTHMRMLQGVGGEIVNDAHW